MHWSYRSLALSHQYTVKCRYNAVQYNMDIAYITAVTEAKYKSEFEPTKYVTYLTLTGELWDVFCENFGENWLHYNSTIPEKTNHVIRGL